MKLHPNSALSDYQPANPKSFSTLRANFKVYGISQ
jgi:hypothetical protein